MKYPQGQKTVSAVYEKTGTDNPLIDALPEYVPSEAFADRIRSLPPIPKNQMTASERRQGIAMLQTVFLPLDYMRTVYDTLYRMIESTYYTQTSRDSVIRINSILTHGTCGDAYAMQAQSGALLGTAGLGKTTTIKRCLHLMPQVIEHQKYGREVFFTKQVLWLFTECPSDASIKTMAFNIVRALDDAVGSNHLDYIMHLRSSATSAVATYIKVLCVTYHVGILCIDEIQNTVIEAQKQNRVKPLIRFLTELTNDSGTAVYFSGLPLAETVFESEEYLRRRTRGPRLLPFRPDGVYREFLMELWPFQYTWQKAELTNKLANQLYDYSGGIPAYITQLFREAQAQAVLQGLSRIDGKTVKAAAEYLNITPPKSYGSGTYLSDFKPINRDERPLETEKPAKRLYGVPRGRKSQKREELDLIAAYEAGSLRAFLLEHQMLEVLPC